MHFRLGADRVLVIGLTHPIGPSVSETIAQERTAEFGNPMYLFGKVLNALLAERTKTNTSAHWIAALNKAGVPCGPINNIKQTFEEPQVKHLGIARRIRHRKLGDIRVVGQPINMSRFPQPETLGPTPDLGEHTDAVLKELGYDAGAIEKLRAAKVV